MKQKEKHYVFIYIITLCIYLHRLRESQRLLLCVDDKTVCHFILNIKHWNEQKPTNMKNVIYKDENGF